MAIACMVSLIEGGVAVPEKVAIIGFDDVPIARFVTPRLSTMGIRIADLGARALDRLIEAIDDPAAPSGEPDHLMPELLVRASSLRVGDGGSEPIVSGRCLLSFALAALLAS